VSHLKLRYVDVYTDVTGKRRHYFRRCRRAPRVALPGLPGSAEFMAAYQAAVDDGGSREPRKERGAAGTFDRLVQNYFESPSYLRLGQSTQIAYRRVIERFVREENIGHRRVDQMNRQHVATILARRAATPGASNDLLKKIKILVGFAIKNGWRKDDPTHKMEKFKGGEFHTWTDDEIALFERHWPADSKERIAFALLLYTGQRISDVVRISWHDIEGNAIHIAQLKTKSKLLIPLHPRLKCLLDAWRRDHMVILATSFGKPFSNAGFGNWMADKIAAAGLPSECVTHGLRKAAARRLAEAGCTTMQIMSVTGHKSISEVERYTRAAQQKGLAEQAIRQLGDGSRTSTP
jgi:integrase